MSPIYRLFATVDGVERQYTFIGWQCEAEFVPVTPEMPYWKTLIQPGEVSDAMIRLPQATMWRIELVK